MVHGHIRSNGTVGSAQRHHHSCRHRGSAGGRARRTDRAVAGELRRCAPIDRTRARHRRHIVPAPCRTPPPAWLTPNGSAARSTPRLLKPPPTPCGFSNHPYRSSRSKGAGFSDEDTHHAIRTRRPARHPGPRGSSGLRKRTPADPEGAARRPRDIPAASACARGGRFSRRNPRQPFRAPRSDEQIREGSRLSIRKTAPPGGRRASTSPATI
jgi:hypothetical protein